MYFSRSGPKNVQLGSETGSSGGASNVVEPASAGLPGTGSCAREIMNPAAISRPAPQAVAILMVAILEPPRETTALTTNFNPEPDEQLRFLVLSTSGLITITYKRVTEQPRYCTSSSSRSPERS